MKKCLIVIPAYNPDSELLTYVENLVQFGFDSILVVDDGSAPEKKPLFDKLEAYSEVTLMCHATNLGKGRALKNAINYFMNLPNQKQWSGLITVDSDGQHLVEDVIKVHKELIGSATSLIMGTRQFDKGDIPIKSKLGNKVTKVLFKLMYGKTINDTQTGLRGITKDILPQFIKLFGERFDYEIHMLIAAVKNKVDIKEIPIQTIYLNGNSESHFRPVMDSLEIYGLLFRNFFKYMGVSLMSFLIDISFFQLFIVLLGTLTASRRIVLASILARIISSLFNYGSNKLYVFKSEKNIQSTVFKYYLLVVLQVASSAALVYFFYSLTGISEIFIKVLIDGLLFFFSYRIQKSLVF
ncbi:bifunctional glycosyltransferase family 2/GtrA family protein [Lacticigenium naphthae]|uniref:bifunctional glycosyltransferase family 2/GtrA family protein n=1 Tax=Lacticigenium naphthae TaxID=515351 RepID=UPI00040A96F6|nr:bifunctional glycosyltransferase family 2/GtrA family protein [Lacticigenium naphthae]